MSSSPDQHHLDQAPTANVARLHAAAAREKGDVKISQTPVSLWVMLGVAGLALAAGGFFMGNVGSDLSAASAKGYNYKPELPAGVGNTAAGLTPEELHQPANWIAAGKGVYSNNCASCHQASGLGAPGQYPHVKGSEFVIHGEKRIAAILLRGINGPLQVDGKGYNGNMQAWAATLTPTQIAQVISYIRNDWGNSAGVIYEDQITEAKKLVGALDKQYNEAELRAIPQDENLPPSKWPALLQKAGAPVAAAKN